MESGIRALTVELAPTLPGDYLPPRGPGGIDQHGELAVVEQVQRAEQLTADRDRFSFKCVGASLRQQSRCAGANGAEGVRKSVPGLSGYSLAAKGGNGGCWSDVAQQSADEQVPLLFDKFY